jgi:hypothetical protein
MNCVPKWVDRSVLCFHLILFGSIILSLSAAFAMRAGLRLEQLDGDELEYYSLAGQIANGSYELGPRRTVGHLLVLGALRKAFDDRLLPIQLAISTIFSLTAPLAYVLARRELRDNRAAVLGGLGVMLWPVFVRYGATIYSETIALPLFMGFLLAMPGPGEAGGRRGERWFGAGVVLGLCMHYRPMYLLYSPLGALVAYWRGRTGRAGVARAALMAAGCLTVVLPWSVFMTAREGTPVLLCSEGGETIAGGLNPELLRIEREYGFKAITAPNGRSTWTGPGKWLTMDETGYLQPEELQLPYSQKSQLLARRAVFWVTTHPGEAAYLSVRKLLYMWGFYPFWNGQSQTVLGNVPIIGLLLLALSALVRLRSCLRTLMILWTLPIFVSLVAMISWGSWRFREPGDLGLILLAAALPYAARVRSLIGGWGEGIPGTTG